MSKTILVVLAAATLSLSRPTTRPQPVAQRHGVVQTHWPNGTLRREATYRDGEYDGTYRTWYQSGRPYERRRYTHGHEDGLQQAWTESGDLYINYEAKDGRHFGLVNSTPCVPAGGDASGLPYYDTPAFTPRWMPVDHRVGPFTLTRQTGERISEHDVAGRINIASFVYTRCAAVCPILVAQLARLQRAVRSLPDVVIVSYSVTPDEDTPQALAAFGRARGIDPKRWWLVTGRRDDIYRLARTSYFADDNRVGSASGRASDAFLHTEKVLLVDGSGHLRGVYNGTQPHEIDQLVGDTERLAKSVDPAP